MDHKTWPSCSWTGVESESLEAVGCDRPASAVVFEAGGAPRYACTEHLAFVQARAHHGGGLRAINRYGAPPGEHRPVRVHVVMA